MKQWILLGILLLVILFLTTRERFEATENIKDPAKWDDFEITRIRNMNTPPLDTTKYPSNMIRTIIGGFWSNWKAATNTITVNQTSNYLDTKVKTDPNATNDPRILLTTEQVNTYRYILQKYYIDQGQPVFAEANFVQYYGQAEAAGVTDSTQYIAPPGSSNSSGSSGSSGAIDPTTGPGQSSLVDLSKPPNAQLSLLKQTIATYAGIPKNDDTKLAYYITPIQNFYNTKYLPNKKQPTLDEINGYVFTVDDSNVPTSMKSSFKSSLTSILDFWFTEPTNITSGGTSGGTSETTGGPKDPATWDDAEIQRVMTMFPWPADSNTSPTEKKQLVSISIKPIVSQFWPKWTAGNGTVTNTDVDSFIDGLNTPEDKESLRTFLKRYFINFSSYTTGGTSGGTGGTSGGTLGGTSSTSGTSTGGSSGTTYGPNSGSSSAFGKNIWGPVFTGVGSPLFNRGTGTTSNADYPLLMGGQSEDESTRIDGVGIVNPSGAGLNGILPSSGSLGSDPNSRFLPGAWQQGTDTTDPYRLMGRYSTASHSTKPDPVPFLTDFSAFFK